MSIDPTVRAALRKIDGMRSQLRARRESAAAKTVTTRPTRAEIARVMREVPTARTAKRTA
jgi:hypothetical protein